MHSVRVKKYTCKRIINRIYTSSFTEDTETMCEVLNIQSKLCRGSGSQESKDAARGWSHGSLLGIYSSVSCFCGLTGKGLVWIITKLPGDDIVRVNTVCWLFFEVVIKSQCHGADEEKLKVMKKKISGKYRDQMGAEKMRRWGRTGNEWKWNENNGNVSGLWVGTERRRTSNVINKRGGNVCTLSLKLHQDHLLLYLRESKRLTGTIRDYSSVISVNGQLCRVHVSLSLTSWCTNEYKLESQRKWRQRLFHVPNSYEPFTLLRSVNNWAGM